MRWLVADTVYAGFLSRAYAPGGLVDTGAPYDEQLSALLGQAFGSSDFYSRHLRDAGHQAADAVLNAVPLQRAWARESATGGWRRAVGGRVLLQRALLDQVRRQQPDVLLLLDVTWCPPRLLRRLRDRAGLVVGQVACPVDFSRDWSGFDLVVSSIPWYVDELRRRGVRSELLPLAFEPSLLGRVAEVPRDVPVSFVGSIGGPHSAREGLLREVAAEVPLQVWGPQPPPGALDGWLGEHYRGEAWGLDMYDVLARSQVVLNRHIDVARDDANNLRLFEATGMGACLVTDRKRNLHDLFVPGAEVLDYGSAAECVAQVRRALDDPDLREQVAAAGRAKTLEHHTYAQRVEQLVHLVEALPARVAPVASRGHQVLAPGEVDPLLVEGWRDPAIPERQAAVVREQLAATRAGKAPKLFRIAAEAISSTGLPAPRVLEVGCASAYYADVLDVLLKGRLSYVGTDYSLPLLEEARRARPSVPVVAGDAGRLPFGDDAADVVLSSAVLMHVPDWETALDECFRVARSAVVLHRTPVVKGSTVRVRKEAYGVPVVELHLGERELLGRCAALGAELVRTWHVEDMGVPELRTSVPVRTYLFRVGSAER